MHPATAASLMNMQDPSTLVSLHTGVPQKKKFQYPRFEKKDIQKGETKGFLLQKPWGNQNTKGLKGRPTFSTKQIAAFKKEGKYFQCGTEGHVAAQCLDRPSTSKGKEANHKDHLCPWWEES